MTSTVVMGVAGCGKSSVGQVLARTLGLPFIEGDAYHPPRNTEKMRKGQPLTDADRADWLASLGQALAQHPNGAVLTCSALKRSYRDQLRAHAPGLRFVFLDVDQATALQRTGARGGQHFFPPSLVNSQFATLESPVGEDGVLRVDATQAADAVVAQALRWLQGKRP